MSKIQLALDGSSPAPPLKSSAQTVVNPAGAPERTLTSVVVTADAPSGPVRRTVARKIPEAEYVCVPNTPHASTGPARVPGEEPPSPQSMTAERPLRGIPGVDAVATAAENVRLCATDTAAAVRLTGPAADAGAAVKPAAARAAPASIATAP